MKTKERMTLKDAKQLLTDHGFYTTVQENTHPHARKLMAASFASSEMFDDVGFLSLSEISRDTVDAQDVRDFIQRHREPFKYYLGTFGFDVNAISYLIEEREFDDVTHRKSHRVIVQKVTEGHEIILFFERNSKTIELKVIDPCGKLAIKAESEQLERLLTFALATTKLTI